MRCTLLAAFALALRLACGAGPTGYVFSTAAKTGDTISGKKLTGFSLPSLGVSAPAINAGGMVAFYATYSEGAYVGEGIFTPASLVLKTGDVVSGQTLDGIGFVPAWNDNGALVVRGLFSSGATAVLTSTTVLAQTGDTIGGQKLISIGPPAINNRGSLAFGGEFSSGTGIFSQTELLAKSGELIGGQKLATFGPPAINDRGTVVFQSWLPGGIASGIFTPTTLLVKDGNTIAGKTLTDLFFGPAINSPGTVAFVGVFAGGTGIFTQNALLVQAGDTIGGQRLAGFSCPVINDSGIVAFLATFPGGEGIFTQKSLIAKTGDTICGKTVTGLGQPAINRGGVVAFGALFSDHSSAIVLARPMIVPTESQNSLWCDK